MIQIVDGIGVGAGKSYFVCQRMVGTVAKGGTVYFADSFGVNRPKFAALVADRFGVVMEDDQLRELPQSDMDRLHEITAPGTEDNPVLIVVDEAQGILNARDWSDKSKRPLFDWLCQSRHDDNDLIFISQSAANIDKQVRRLVTEVVRTRNLKVSKVPILGGIPVFIQMVLDQDCTTKLESRWVWHDPGIFGAYFSKSQKGKHKRLAGAIPRKQLAKASKPLNMKLIIAIILLAAGVLVWALMDDDAKPAAFKEKATAAAPAAPGPVERLGIGKVPAAAGAAPSLEILVEDFRGFITGPKFTQLRTASGWYVLGEVSRHGLVDGISERAVRIQRPTGGQVFIVAEEKSLSVPVPGPAMVTPGATPPPAAPAAPAAPATPATAAIGFRF